jgi:hypothetical protein
MVLTYGDISFILTVLFTYGCYAYTKRHNRITRWKIQQIENGNYEGSPTYEGQPMPHDMNALMWYDL